MNIKKSGNLMAKKFDMTASSAPCKSIFFEHILKFSFNFLKSTNQTKTQSKFKKKISSKKKVDYYNNLILINT
jgi:hypothetical protein